MHHYICSNIRKTIFVQTGVWVAIRQQNPGAVDNPPNEWKLEKKFASLQFTSMTHILYTSDLIKQLSELVTLLIWLNQKTHYVMMSDRLEHTNHDTETIRCKSIQFTNDEKTSSLK